MQQQEQTYVGPPEQPRWWVRWWVPTRRQLLWARALAALAIVAALTVAVLIGYRYGITLWDWIKLLIVPAVIAGAGLWFNRQQRERELAIAREQREREVEIAERRAQDEALQAYLDQMSGMLIPNREQPSLYKARPGDILSQVARARTLTVLTRLSGARKRSVLQFVYESGLILKNRPIIFLWEADMRGIELSHDILRQAFLRGAIMYEARLWNTNLSDADLVLASLRDAWLRAAKLNGADLRGADLRGADLERTELRGADLRGIMLRPGFDAEGDAKRGWSLDKDNDELERRVGNPSDKNDPPLLQGATMPNGQKYEDWLNNEIRGKALSATEKVLKDLNELSRKMMDRS